MAGFIGSRVGVRSVSWTVSLSWNSRLVPLTSFNCILHSVLDTLTSSTTQKMFLSWLSQRPEPVTFLLRPERQICQQRTELEFEVTWIYMKTFRGFQPRNIFFPKVTDCQISSSSIREITMTPAQSLLQSGTAKIPLLSNGIRSRRSAVRPPSLSGHVTSSPPDLAEPRHPSSDPREPNPEKER